MVDLNINGEVIHGIELVIFDKDGTLIDLYHYWANMVDLRVTLAQNEFCFDINKKLDVMAAMGIDAKNKRLFSSGPVGIKKREDVRLAMVNALSDIGVSNIDEKCVEFFERADRASLDCLGNIVRPAPGMRQLIDELRVNGCKTAIATTDKTERAKLAVNALGISEKIDVVIGDDLVMNGKPAPDAVFKILNELNIDKRNGVMIGDATTDVMMGINAGLPASIGVESGVSGREALEKLTRHVIKDISMITVN